MQTKFRFTNAAIKALPAQQREAGATELEFSDTEVIGLKLLSGKAKAVSVSYCAIPSRARSAASLWDDSAISM